MIASFISFGSVSIASRNSEWSRSWKIPSSARSSAMSGSTSGQTSILRDLRLTLSRNSFVSIWHILGVAEVEGAAGGRAVPFDLDGCAVEGLDGIVALGKRKLGDKSLYRPQERREAESQSWRRGGACRSTSRYASQLAGKGFANMRENA